MDYGFDVSHWQGAINWDAIPDRFHFAYAKCTEGGSILDPQYARNRLAATTRGIRFFGYHFMRPSSDVHTCAALFVETLQQTASMLMPCLDAETDDGMTATALHDWIHEFRAYVLAETGRLTSTYTGYEWWQTYVAPAAANCADCAASPLLLARYAANIGKIPQPWTYATMWQFTDAGKVAGIGAKVDEDKLLFGTVSDLLGYPKGNGLLDAMKYTIVYVRDNTGSIYEANLLSGTYWHVPNPADVADRQEILAAAGIPVRAGLQSVDNMSVYGIEIK